MTKQMNTFFFYHFLTLTLTVIFSEGSKRVRREVIFIYINIKYYINILLPISAASRNKNCQCQCQQNAAPESPSIAFLSALIYDLSLITLRVASPYSIFFVLLTRIAPPACPPFPAIPSQVPLRQAFTFLPFYLSIPFAENSPYLQPEIWQLQKKCVSLHRD